MNNSATMMVTRNTIDRLWAGDPAPEVSWWQDQRLIDRHSEFHNQQDGVRNVLKLERMGRPDLHTSISCQASNTQLSLPLTKALSVEVNRKSEHQLTLIRLYIYSL